MTFPLRRMFSQEKGELSYPTAVCTVAAAQTSVWLIRSNVRRYHHYTVNGKIIARLNNCALLNFRAFRIYLW